MASDVGRRGERERFPGRQQSVSLPHLRSEPTWENGVEHSGSRCFADTEEVTGSNPVAPTARSWPAETLSRLLSRRRPSGDAGHFAVWGPFPGMRTG
jgi:hypothetical protein